jgi:hypothetical protein
MGTKANQMMQVEYIVNPMYFASLKFSAISQNDLKKFLKSVSFAWLIA